LCQSPGKGLFRWILNNDFNGVGWANGVAGTAHIAFGVVDNKLFNLFINGLEGAPFPAFPAGTTILCNTNAPEWNLLAAEAKACTQLFMGPVRHLKFEIKHFPPTALKTKGGHGRVSESY
jgi:hypothetical protein